MDPMRPLPSLDELRARLLDARDVDRDDDGLADVVDTPVVVDVLFGPCHTPVVYEALGGGRFRVFQDVDYDLGDEPSLPEAMRRFTVPAGFVTDRATMPMPTRALLDRDLLDPSATAHDWWLSARRALGVARVLCDRVFLVVALRTPVLPDWKARVAHRLIRANSVYAESPAVRAAVGVVAHAARGLLPWRR